MTDYADEGLRCIAFAYIDSPAHSDNKYRDPDQYAKLETSMTFVGLAAMMDPPRSEVLESIRVCRQAGIRVVVITGDNKATAVAICRQIGIFKPNQSVDGMSAMFAHV